jgi:hypothetical protein
MSKLITAILFAVTSFMFSASWASPNCSDWKKITDRSCSFADKSSDYNGVRWERHCSYETVCKNRKVEHTDCEAEKICLMKGQNPNEMTTPCTDWVPRNDVECVNGKTSWIRACQMSGIGYPDTACSDSYPQD